ncbi:MAG: hypothetical protein ACYC3I_22655 [Gemmataceae bacterium]
MNYSNTPHGIAVQMWSGMNQRAGNRNPRYKSYADVAIKMTRDEWLAWAEPRIKQFMLDNPKERPSIDRIDNRGNYEIGNMRIISWTEHRRLKKLVRWERYVNYLSQHPQKLQAFVARHAHKITAETNPQSIINSIGVLLGRPLSVAERSTLELAIANPELLLNLMYVIDNAR